MDKRANKTNERNETRDGFTPGPWEISSSVIVVSNKPGNLKIICSTASFDALQEHSPTMIEAMANARLIAAAPKLLEACKRSLLEITNCGDHDLVQFVESAINAVSNPLTVAATTVKTLDQTESAAEWFDEQEERWNRRNEWSLLDEGRNPDGTGLSYAERNA